MPLNKFAFILMIVGYFVIYKENSGTGPFIAWSILSGIVLFGILFTTLIEYADKYKTSKGLSWMNL